LQFLQSSAAHAAYAGARQRVETIESHMSWVFLVGEFALKLKKSVRYPFLDFSTLEAREFFCREELRLNSRLAPGVYRGLLALRWGEGAWTLVPEDRVDTQGQTVDWLVVMRRLPAESMLSRRMVDDAVAAGDIDALADVLIEFYRHASVAELSDGDYLGRFQREQAANREILLRPQFHLDGAGHALDRLDLALVRHGAALRERAARGRIVDGHGDLRPEHVYLLQPPVVIDCLEFNAGLRQVDVFDELAFLGLECEMANAAWIGPRLAGTCARALGDTPAPPLMPLYTAYRALLRARLAMAHLLDPQPRTPQKWAPLAQRYVERCLAALDELERVNGLSAATTRGNP
jgi:aminoglycoside phosphotransferase family enzyme